MKYNNGRAIFIERAIKKKRIKELIPKMKQRIYTKNEAKNLYQKWSKEFIPKMKQRIYTKNEAKNLYQKLSKEDESY